MSHVVAKELCLLWAEASVCILFVPCMNYDQLYRYYEWFMALGNSYPDYFVGGRAIRTTLKRKDIFTSIGNKSFVTTIDFPWW